MNLPLLGCAVLAGIGAVVHGTLPEIAILRGAMTQELPRTALPAPLRFLGHDTPGEDTKLQWRYLRIGWHFLTIDAATTSLLLLLAAFGQLQHASAIAQVTALRYAAYGCLWLVGVALWHRSIFRAPQWLFLFLVAALAWWGSTVS